MNLLKRINEWHAKGGPLQRLLFFDARPAGHDYAGWWRVQLGLVVLLWLQIAHLILTIVELFCE